jgi:hypothetical protein
MQMSAQKTKHCATTGFFGYPCLQPLFPLLFTHHPAPRRSVTPLLEHNFALATRQSPHWEKLKRKSVATTLKPTRFLLSMPPDHTLSAGYAGTLSCHAVSLFLCDWRGCPVA